MLRQIEQLKQISVVLVVALGQISRVNALGSIRILLRGKFIGFLRLSLERSRVANMFSILIGPWGSNNVLRATCTAGWTLGYI